MELIISKVELLLWCSSCLLGLFGWWSISIKFGASPFLGYISEGSDFWRSTFQRWCHVLTIAFERSCHVLTIVLEPVFRNRSDTWRRTFHRKCHILTIAFETCLCLPRRSWWSRQIAWRFACRTIIRSTRLIAATRATRWVAWVVWSVSTVDST